MSVGNLSYCSVMPTVKNKQTKVYCCVHMEHPVFQFVPTVLSPGTAEESLDLSSMNPLFRYLNTLIRSPQAMSSPG